MDMSLEERLEVTENRLDRAVREIKRTIDILNGDPKYAIDDALHNLKLTYEIYNELGRV